MVESGTITPPQLMDVMSNIMVFFGIAGLVVPLLQRFKMSPVLAYLFCGIAIGPHALGMLAETYAWLQPITVKDAGTVHLLGELGIITLMFMIGLELSFHRLKELKKYIFGLGTAQIIITATVIFIIAKLFNNSPEVAIIIGAAFALSSTAIVMKLLEEKHLTNQPVGILCFSILLMQDLAVIPILILASSFSGGSPEKIVPTIFISLVVGIVTVAAILIVGRRVLAPLLQSVSLAKNPEWLATFVVFIVVACAALTNTAGLSLALGAFLAGLLIAETEYRHEVEVIIGPLKGLLLGIFFLSIGMMIDIQEIISHPFLLSASVIGIFVIKAAVLFPICLLFKVPPHRAAKASLFLAQPGEFALLILGVALATNMMPAIDVQFFFLVTALAMMFSPLLFKLAPYAGNITARIFGEELRQQEIKKEQEEKTVIIAGFGHVGQMLGKALEEEHIPYIAFDKDLTLVEKLKAEGINIVHGDARDIVIWQQLHSENIYAAAIAINDYTAQCSILRSLHEQWPLLHVIVRSKDTDGIDSLYDNGANDVVSESLEASLRMAHVLMHRFGREQETTDKLIEKLRRNDAMIGIGLQPPPK